VLVVGGERASSVPEIWDPTTNEWTQTGPASTVRWLPALARLKDGRVLAAGGWDGQYLASAELYDPDTDEWTDTTPLGEARSGPGAAVLPDGRVLVAGGGGFIYTPKVYPFQSRRAELFDPATEQWTRTGDLTFPRTDATSMVTLADGRPAIVGGFWWKNIDPSVPVWSGDTYERTGEVYDAAHGTWILTPPDEHRPRGACGRGARGRRSVRRGRLRGRDASRAHRARLGVGAHAHPDSSADRDRHADSQPGANGLAHTDGHADAACGRPQARHTRFCEAARTAEGHADADDRAALQRRRVP
jgi:hypothetical protein